MSEKKKAFVLSMASILSLVAGVVIGYTGHNLFAPGSESSSLSVSSNAGRAHPSAQAESGERQRGVGVPLKIDAHQAKKEARIEEASPRQSAGGYERVLDIAASIADLHERMPEPGPVVGRGEHDSHPDHSDDLDLLTKGDAEREKAYNAQSALIAELESQLNPPNLEPDEGELEDQYRYDGLPEIEAWEEAETLQDDPREMVLESEDPILLEPEPLPPP
jgi:hypothetical protein